MNGEIKVRIQEMSGIISEMIDLVFRGFMENDMHILDKSLDKERALDDLEKEIAAGIVKLSKGLSDRERKKLVIAGQIAENIERMGDELRYLTERIELKIADKLYFSDKGVEQYKEVFEKMQRSVSLIVRFLGDDDAEVLDKVLENGDQIKELIERYRAEHIDRLARGICEPRAANMYFDMLDFTGNIARHCTNIARISKK